LRTGPPSRTDLPHTSKPNRTINGAAGQWADLRGPCHAPRMSVPSERANERPACANERSIRASERPAREGTIRPRE